MQEDPQQRKTIRDKVKNLLYVKGKLLGTGGFAKCFEVINQDNGSIYAAKVIPKKSINEKRQRYKLLVEIKIHRALKHRHIVQFREAFEDRENVYILLEYCRNYTLKDLVKRRKRLTEYEAKIYTAQVVKAIIYIHSQSIIHRDLKLGNILINDNMETKICDFGLSTRVKNEGEIKKTICGTPNYIAPEILDQTGHSYEVDVWSIGVILYTLLFGKPPFQDNTVEQTYENIKNNRFMYPSSVNVSLQAKDLINKILVTDPSRRIGLEDILEHQFMNLNEGIPKNLPTSTLAVPPVKFAKLESKRINLHDVNLEMSEELESYVADPSQQIESSLEGTGKKAEKMTLPHKNFPMPYIYIRQCFFSGETLGYLLSNGVVGIYYKNTSMNVILQYGSANYFIITKNNENKPIKKPLPANDFELNSVMQTDYLQLLLNFKAYFVTKYGFFRMDEMRKKQAMKMSMTGQDKMESLLIYVKKSLSLPNGEVLTRLSNSAIQLHFKDLSNVSINKDDDQGIYFMNSNGRASEVNYNECKNNNIRIKIRRFSNIMQKLSQGGQQYSAPQSDEGEEEQKIEDESDEMMI